MKRKIEYNNSKIYVKITKDNVKIIDSYKITNEKDMRMILSIISIYPEYKLTRKRDDLIDEWKSHNLAYKFHILRKHSKDTDLSENESKIRLILYKIISAFL